MPVAHDCLIVLGKAETHKAVCIFRIKLETVCRPKVHRMGIITTTANYTLSFHHPSTAAPKFGYPLCDTAAPLRCHCIIY